MFPRQPLGNSLSYSKQQRPSFYMRVKLVRNQKTQSTKLHPFLQKRCVITRETRGISRPVRFFFFLWNFAFHISEYSPFTERTYMYASISTSTEPLLRRYPPRLLCVTGQNGMLHQLANFRDRYEQTQG